MGSTFHLNILEKTLGKCNVFIITDIVWFTLLGTSTIIPLVKISGY